MSPTKRATHPIESGIAVVPAFIIKLWKLVEDPSCNHLICWSGAETSFIIKNQIDFAKDLLPRYFKHSNLASFIRQLNFYGFRKISNVDGKSLQHEKNETEFFHPFFIRQQKGLLCLIKRKVAKAEEAVAIPDVQDLLTDVKVLQGKQETVDSLLSEMKQENQVLWQEIAQLREKHAKQQRIVAKLIHFLATLVRPKSGSISIKRKVPLMIDVRKTPLSSLDQHVSTSKKLKKDICLSVKTNYCNASAKLNNMHDKENSDLTIHDVTCDNSSVPCFSASQADYVIVESPLADVTDNGNIEGSCVGNSLEPLSLLEPLQSNFNFSASDDDIDMPEEKASLDETENICVGENGVIEENVADLSTSFQQSKTNETSLDGKMVDNDMMANRDQQSNLNIETHLSKTDSITKNVLNEHVQYAGSELDWIHEQLSQEQVNIDNTDILNLFTADDAIPENPLLDVFPIDKADGIAGSEVLPCLSASLDFSILDPLEDSLPGVLSMVSSVDTTNGVENDTID